MDNDQNAIDAAGIPPAKGKEAAFPGTTDTRTPEEVDAHIKQANASALNVLAPFSPVSDYDQAKALREIELNGAEEHSEFAMAMDGFIARFMEFIEDEYGSLSARLMAIVQDNTGEFRKVHIPQP